MILPDPVRGPRPEDRRVLRYGVGPKRAPDSYRRIAAALGADPASILFVSDVLDELSAAADAGCRVALCVRPGNPPFPHEPPGSIPVVRELGKIEV